MALAEEPDDHATDSAIPTQAFSYSPLCTAQAFRLLQILPARNDAGPIRCTIEEVDRGTASHVVYRALSYTWGDASALLPISLNGQIAYVTHNLHKALLHLRVTHSHTNLWIDAICIDQCNVLERMHQVKQMKRIYSEAKEVIAWLGPKHEHIKRLFFSIEQHIEDHEKYCQLSRCLFRSQEPASYEGTTPDYQRFDSNLIHALRYLEGQPYWRRVWIIQEIVTAKRVVLLSGNNTLMWSSLTKFRSLLMETSQLLGDTIHSLASWPRDSVGLAQALFFSEASISTNSRDKVYAILGLVNRGAGRNLSADYTLAPCTVFCLAVRAMIADWNQDLFDRKVSSAFIDESLACTVRSAVHPIVRNCVELASYYVSGDTAHLQKRRVHSCDGTACGSQRALIEITACWRHWEPSQPFQVRRRYRELEDERIRRLKDWEITELSAFWKTALITPIGEDKHMRQPLQEIKTPSMPKTRAFTGQQNKARAYSVARHLGVKLPIDRARPCQSRVVNLKERRKAMLESFGSHWGSDVVE